MDLIEWKIKNARAAAYAHFDKKVGIDATWNYITDPNKVKSHSFFPFISYEQVFYKYKKEKKDKSGKVIQKERVEGKIRPICYSAHMDRCIYKYYGFLLNEKYNEYIDREGISNSVVAYRTNLYKNNIHFAKEAFDFMKKSDCNIVVGDFKGFFDNLNHKYLKKMMCKVLGVNVLTDDWYAVYKNITKYSTWRLMDILKINGLISDEDIKKKERAHLKALQGKSKEARRLKYYFDSKIDELNGFNISDYRLRVEKLALTKEQFKRYRKECVVGHKKNYGIPQGSSISAILSNVYMIEFDKVIYEFIKKLNGLYLRYSDDFIIIYPKDACTVDVMKDYLNNAVDKTKGLKLEANKTKVYTYFGEEIFNVTDINKVDKSHIDYLGFIFDGKQVTLRPKTISKYYYRMNRKLNSIIRCNGKTKKGNRVSYNELYRIYTQKGRNGVYDESKFPEKIILKDSSNPYKSGNFLSYVYRADKIFNKEHFVNCKVNNSKNKKEPITQSTKRHMLKIRRVRDKIANSDNDKSI